jgi:hypothetical protein
MQTVSVIDFSWTYYRYALFDGFENTGRFDDVFGVDRSPIDAGRVAFLEDSDGVTINDELAVLGFNLSLEAAVDRVILEHVDLITDEDL